MELSIVIPAFNEEAKILKDLEAACAYAVARAKQFTTEIIFVNDGSTDQTAELIQHNINKYEHPPCKVRLVSYKSNRGKGYAVKTGILASKGQWVAFVDSGLCVPFDSLDDGLALLAKGFDYAIASRRDKNSQIKCAQPLHRRLGSKVFSWVIHEWMGLDFVTDTQCGFKVYKQKPAFEIFSRVKTDGFMFDVESLMIAKKLGFRGAEFAVEWSNDSDTRYHPVFGTFRNFKELRQIQKTVG